MVAPLPEAGDVILGRGMHVDVRLSDRAAGLRHARLTITDTGFFIEDLGTAAGTQVGGVAIAAHVRSPVLPGEGIVIGETVLMVREVMREERPRRIWSHTAFVTRLEEECERACRGGSEFSLVRLCITPPSVAALSDDEPAHLVLDPARSEAAVLAALALVAPAPHVVGLYGNHEYELLFVGDSIPRAQERLRSLFESLADAGVQVRAGLAHFPVDGREGETLIEHANHRLFGATGSTDAPDPPLPFELADLSPELRQLVEAAAAHDAPICLVGERGIGKESLARAIHGRSSRAHGPFRVVELRRIPAAEIEAELFGTRRGGRGLVTDCRDGTLFLAGSETLPRGLALRIAFSLRNKAASARSGPGPRIIIGSEGASVISRRYPGRGQVADVVGAERLVVLPLRERREEMPELVDRLVAECGRLRGTEPGVSAEQRLAWCGRDWPGNIRELRNEIDRAVAGAARPAATGAVAEVITQRIDLPPGIEGGERERIVAVLVACAFNQSRAAAHLGMSRRTLLTRLDQLGIERPLKGSTPLPALTAGKAL